MIQRRDKKWVFQGRSYLFLELSQDSVLSLHCIKIELIGRPTHSPDSKAVLVWYIHLGKHPDAIFSHILCSLFILGSLLWVKASLAGLWWKEGHPSLWETWCVIFAMQRSLGQLLRAQKVAWDTTKPALPSKNGCPETCLGRWSNHCTTQHGESQLLSLYLSSCLVVHYTFLQYKYTIQYKILNDHILVFFFIASLKCTGPSFINNVA